MKIECTIDGSTLSLNLNSNKPLSRILMDNLDNRSIKTHCEGEMCGQCIVLINNKPVLSCLVPAFEIRGRNIITFDSFQKTKNYKDIEKAYEIVKARACTNCFNAKTLIIESLISRGETSEEDIIKELSIVKCHCLTPQDAVKIVKEAIEIRRRRRVRRS